MRNNDTAEHHSLPFTKSHDQGCLGNPKVSLSLKLACSVLQVLVEIPGGHLAGAAHLCHQGTAMAHGPTVLVLGIPLHCCHRSTVARQQSRHCVDSGGPTCHLLLCPHVWQLVS